jgi:hypothetical protein
MNVIDVSEATGEQLGSEGVEQLFERAKVVCALQKTKIELTNQPAIVVKKAEYAVLVEEGRELQERLYHIQPPQGVSARIRKIVVCWVVASVLVVGGFVLSLLTLEPYRLGLKGVFYCVGIALVAPFLLERVLELFASETLRRVITVLACVGSLASLMLLAAIRGNLLAQQTREYSAPVVIDGEERSQDDQSKNTFYKDTVPFLQLVMVLLAFSMEIGAGLAVHEAERASGSAGEEYNHFRRELGGVRKQLSSLAQETVALENEGAIFAATFWRDFYWSLLKKTLRSAASRFVLPVALLIVVFPLASRAQEATDLVIALDLTESVGKKGPDGKSDFDKNVASVGQLLAQVAPGTHVTVLGITDNSFGQPYILLSARVDSDAGYFEERITDTRRQLANAWRSKSQGLTAHFAQTDILGALLVASQLFYQSPSNHRRILVIFSDMRQDTREFTVECHANSVDDAVSRLRRRQLIADLSGSDVYVLGVNDSTAKIGKWISIREFWLKYFAAASSTLRQYSSLHELRGGSRDYRSHRHARRT